MAENIQGIVIDIGGDMTGLKSALKTLDAPINKLQSELKSVESGLKLDPTNTNLLAQKQELLAKAISDTKNKLIALNNAKTTSDTEMANGTRIDQEQYRKLQREIVFTENSLKKLQSSANGNALSKPLDSATASAKKFDSSIDNAKASTKQLNSEVTKTSAQANKLSSTMSSVIKGVVMGYTGKALVEYLIGSNAQMEQYTTSFEVLLGSADKASSMMADLTDFAAKTPLELPDVTKQANQLLNYGIASEQLIPTLTKLGDLSGGQAQKLEAVARAYGQMTTNGKVSLEDLNQMTEAGVPMLQALADTMGITTAETRKMITAGTVGMPQLNTAIDSLTTGSGKFAGMMDKQSQTMNGMISTLKDNFAQFGRDVGEEAFEQVKGSVQDLLDTMDKASKDGTLAEVADGIGNSINLLVKVLTGAVKVGWEYRDVLLAGVEALAAYKITASVATGIENLKSKIIQFKEANNAATLSQAAFNAVANANPYAIAAAAIVGTIVLIKKIATSSDEATKKQENVAAQLSDEYAGLKSDVENLNEELKTTQARIAELSKQPSLSFVEENELTKLKETNVELEKQIELKEIDAQNKGKEATDASVKTLEDYGNRQRYGTGYTNAGGEVAWYDKAGDTPSADSDIYERNAIDNMTKRYTELSKLKNATKDEKAELDSLKVSLTDIAIEYQAAADKMIPYDDITVKAKNSALSVRDTILATISKTPIIDSSWAKSAEEDARNGLTAIAETVEQGTTEVSADFKTFYDNLKQQKAAHIIDDKEYNSKLLENLTTNNYDKMGAYNQYWGEVLDAQDNANEKALSEQKTANEKIISEQEKASEKQQKLAEDDLKTWETGFDKIADSAKTAFDDINKQQENMANKLADTTELFKRQTVGEKDNVMVLSNIDEQTQKLKLYDEALKNLKSAGASKDFMSEVTSMGVDDALDYSKNLLDKPQDELQAYLASWQENKDTANQIASDYYADDANTLKTEFTDKIRNSLAEMPASANLIGQDTASEFVKGMKSKLAELNTSMNLTAQQAMTATVKTSSTAVGGTSGGNNQNVGVISNASLPPIQITVQSVIDGKVVGETATKYINAASYAQGRSVVK